MGKQTSNPRDVVSDARREEIMTRLADELHDKNYTAGDPRQPGRHETRPASRQAQSQHYQTRRLA